MVVWWLMGEWWIDGGMVGKEIEFKKRGEDSQGGVAVSVFVGGASNE